MKTMLNIWIKNGYLKFDITECRRNEPINHLSRFFEIKPRLGLLGTIIMWITIKIWAKDYYETDNT